jgi:glyoxylase-like metal-dependent hydrolase (beta-lactamase superfamily II)
MVKYKVSPSRGLNSPRVIGVYDEDTGSCQYIVADEATGKAALIDVVMDFDPQHAATSMDTAREVLALVERASLEVVWILDTHPHADHLMASAWLKKKLGAPTAIGYPVHEAARLWRDLYHMEEAFDPDAAFDHLFRAGDTFKIGQLQVRVMHSPGHTPASITYVVGQDSAFVHDTLMHVDVGTARADFPGGSARQLYHSIQEILALPEGTRLFVGHDYGTDRRDEPAWEATVGQHRRDNVHVGGGTTLREFVELRTQRDSTLALPDRMLFALQVNLRGGRLPKPESDGHSYFKIPANRCSKEERCR